MQLFSAAAGLDTTKEDYWYKYNKMRLKELVDASNGYLKRDYSAEKIGETILDCDKVIGYAVNRDTGAKIETKYFRVHYSKDKGFHAVPEFPSKGVLKE